MSYQSGMLNERVTILNQAGGIDTVFGRKGSTYLPAATLWAAADYARGQKAMRQGTLDAYDVIMIRTRYSPAFKRSSRVEWRNKIYKVDSYHADEKANTIQVTATELVNA